MADRKLAYASPADFTCTLASLATSATLVQGRQATSISNTTNKYIDYLLSGKVTLGTSPTASRIVECWVIPKSGGTWPLGFGATDGAFPSIDRTQLTAIGYLLWQASTIGTTGTVYEFSKLSLRKLIGYVPEEFTLALTHSTGVNLNSTAGNHFLRYQGVYETVT